MPKYYDYERVLRAGSRFQLEVFSVSAPNSPTVEVWVLWHVGTPTYITIPRSRLSVIKQH
jgi:hypothetical protein